MLATSAHTLGETMARRIPLQEAARVLGLSERTVRRRLLSGALAGEKDPASGRWHVTMPDEVPDTPADAASTPDNADHDLRQRVAVLEVQLEATRRELATSTSTLAIERRRYDDQRETFETMLRLLPAPPERRRRWRWPWRRE